MAFGRIKMDDVELNTKLIKRRKSPKSRFFARFKLARRRSTTPVAKRAVGRRWRKSLPGKRRSLARLVRRF